MRGLIKGKESKVREVDLNSSVPSILETYKELGGKYEVNLVASGNAPVSVRIDPTQFEIVLLNLLNNASEAIMHQETKPIITLEISGENGEAAITVANEGFLEHEESFNNLFAVKNSTKVNGLGLGLAIAARVVERWAVSSVFVSTIKRSSHVSFFRAYRSIRPPLSSGKVFSQNCGRR